MHNTIDYSNRPAAAFDAVEDVKDWLGRDKWDEISAEMAKVTNCAQFALYASIAGIQGFPVKAWYELYHGQGSWKVEEPEWSGTPDPLDPDNYWIDDVTGERVKAP